MKNNIPKNYKIKYIKLSNYHKITNKNIFELRDLKTDVKEYLNNIRGFIKNESTGYVAKINSRSIGKILYPAPYFNPFVKNYINNLNAALKLKELFEKSVYIDTLKPMKGKEKNKNELGYHHFVAPLVMNNTRYRILITAREKINSNVLYIISSEVYEMKVHIWHYFFYQRISLTNLINGVKIYNYDIKDYEIYDINKIKIDDNLIKEEQEEYLVTGSISYEIA